MERISAESYCVITNWIYSPHMTEPDTTTNQSADEIPQVIESAETPAETPPARKKCGKKKGPPFAVATFRLAPEALKIIRAKAKELGISQGEVVNRTIAKVEGGAQ